MIPGRSDEHEDPKPPSLAVPYTGGDVASSGELGKMFNIPTGSPRSGKRGGLSGPDPVSGSGPIPKKTGMSGSNPNSGPGLLPKRTGLAGSNPSSGSGSLIGPTGLITSGPAGSSGPGRASDGVEMPSPGGGKVVYGSAVTTLGYDELRMGFRLSKRVMWVFFTVGVIALVVGGLLMAAIKKPAILVIVAAVVVPIMAVVLWNVVWKRRGLMRFLKGFPDAELRGAVDGQYVKVTGVVTCGSIPLESSFQRVPRCVYVSTELFEYRGWGGKSANPKHRLFSWGCRNSEKYVADFYISDLQSGLRAIVKAGYGAKVAPFVKETTVIDVTRENRELSPNFLSWLSDRNLSSDDRIMRLKEGYIKEGSTVSVMGVVRRHDNVLMIVPPTQPMSTGCQWTRALLPTYVEGLILTCDESQNIDSMPV